jgi:uncharacterized protein with PIN domain
MSRYVLDASAVLALLNQEPGTELVEGILGESTISAVNASEVLTKLIDAGMPIDEARESFDLLGLEVVDFNKECAWSSFESGGSHGRARMGKAKDLSSTHNQMIFSSKDSIFMIFILGLM